LTDFLPILYRELIIYKKRLFKLSYVLSALISPLIYLAVFGFGLGENLTVTGTNYITFLLPGLIAMTSMTNSYIWIANGLNIDRLYFKTFQLLVQAPIKPIAILMGIITAGIIRGLFASSLIISVGLLCCTSFSPNGIFWLGLLLNCFMFSTLGVIIGMITKSHEETAIYSNFLMVPMAFFSGTFFPLEKLPFFVKPLIYALPLTYSTILIRKSQWDRVTLLSLFITIGFSLMFLFLALRLIKNYRE